MNMRRLTLGHSHSPVSYHQTIADAIKRVVHSSPNHFIPYAAHKCKITVKVKITLLRRIYEKS